MGFNLFLFNMNYFIFFFILRSSSYSKENIDEIKLPENDSFQNK